MSKVQALYHIVFATKNRALLLPLTKRDILYRYIWNLLDENGCFLYRIGGMGDHVHMLIDLNPTIALSDLMRQVKANSSSFLKQNPDFPPFFGWGTGYFAASASNSHKDEIIAYIANQHHHHTGVHLEDEIKWLMERCGLSYHEDDMR